MHSAAAAKNVASTPPRAPYHDHTARTSTVERALILCARVCLLADYARLQCTEWGVGSNVIWPRLPFQCWL